MHKKELLCVKSLTFFAYNGILLVHFFTKAIIFLCKSAIILLKVNTMKKTKRILALVMAAVLICLTFAGCAEQKTDSDADKVYKIGICQLLPHAALDKATEGFQAALKEKLGDKVQFDSQNAGGEKTNCTTIISKFVSDDVDLIMANATDALAAASEATEDIPIVATSITDYATALNITDWKGVSGFNVTGTSDLAPLDQQAAMIKELVPDAEKVGILYCSSESNSKFQEEEITKYLVDLGFKSENIKVYTFVDTNDITAVAQKAVGDCDVIYIPTDNKAADNTEAINNVAEPEGVPIIAGESGICSGCGVATLSIDYYDIGYRAGEMAYEILVNGADPAEMKIESASETTKLYVASRAKALGIEIPEGYEAMEEN